MSVVKKTRVYAHSSGHTDVSYSTDGKYLLTCGSDGDLRIRLGFDDPDPISQGVDDSCLAITSCGETMYCGSTALNIAMYALPRGERIGVLSRFQADCTHLSLSQDGKYIASGSCDMSVHVTNTSTFDDTVFPGHKGPILGVALDPKCEFLVSSSGDGTIRVWSVASQEVLKTWYDIAPKGNDFFVMPSLARPCWQPKGRLLAIAAFKKIIIISRGTWDTFLELDDPKVDNWYSVCQFSPCGSMLAACTKNGILSVWNVDLSQLIASETSQRPIPLCGVAWNPKYKDAEEVELSLTDTEGHLTTMMLKLPSEVIARPPSPAGTVSSAVDDIKITTTYDSDIDDAASVGGAESEVGSTVGDKKMPTIARYVSSVPEFKLQEPFQPSSTPVTLERRFMVYNSVGTVQAYNGDSEEKTIDVEFHNNSVFHNFSLPNTHDHTMATLSSEALVLSGETQSSETGSKIQGMPLQGNTGNQFWSIDLPEDEEVVGLAASEDFIAVATNLQYLRLLTIGGVQREVYSIPGRFLCMAASKSKLMIVSHASPAMGSDQNLQFMLLKVTMPGVKVEMPRPLPISPNSELQWCGFTEESIPCTFDSSGVLRVLLEPEIWQVLCSTRALREAGILTLNLKSDHVFVVSISLSTLTLRCILCKGSRYPHTSPTPTVVPVIMKVPTAEMHTDKGLCEGSLVQIRALCDLLENPSLADEFKDLAGHQLQTLSKAALKLFALTANQDTVKKTVEVYKLLPSMTLRELTRKYAQQAKKHSLLEVISELEDAVSDEFISARDDKWSTVPARNTFAIDASSEESKQATSSPVPILAPLMPRSALSRRRSFMSNPSNSVDSEVSLSRAPKSALNRNNSLDTSTFSDIGSPDKNPFKRSNSVNKPSVSRSFHPDLEDSTASVQTVNDTLSPPPVEAMEEEDSQAEVIECSQQVEIAPKPPVEPEVKETEDTPPTKNPFMASKGFKEWLAANKSRVCAAHPNLDKKDQIKAALEMFSKEKNNPSNGQTEVSSENQAPKKRPAEELAKNPAKIAKTTVNKLQNFILKKQ